VAALLKNLELNTVCQSARCPNLNECWHRQTATFLILGEFCTRNCRFCAVEHQASPAPPAPDEPARIAEGAKRLGLQYVVITSVTRDDLADGGAGHFVACIQAVRQQLPEAEVEVLTPDFQGDKTALATVLAAGPTVFNHNIETVKRLTCGIRSGADYDRSLQVLTRATEIRDENTKVKSGLMVGMGESNPEVEAAIRDIRHAGATLLTIGQYLPPSRKSPGDGTTSKTAVFPSRKHWPVDRYVKPEIFDQWRNLALKIGFEQVASAPLVRSSYRADELV